MSNPRLIGWGVAALCVIAVIGSGFFNSSLPTYRYRLTVEVDTPKGLKSGSGVVEVHTTEQGSWNIDSPGLISTEVYGEAVAVDLPSGSTLFAVEPNRWGSFLVHAYEATVPPTEITGDMHKRLKRALAYRDVMTLPAPIRGTVASPGQHIYPLLARFRDLAVPLSVEEVPFDNLAASFGPGYSLRRITVQLTDEPVTTGIQARLPWLPELRKRRARLNGSTSILIDNNELSNNLSSSSFSLLN